MDTGIRKSAGKRLLWYLLAIGIPCLTLIAIAILHGFAPFGNSSIFTGDLNGIFVPFLASYKDALRDGSLFFDFSKQLGGSLANVYFQLLLNPLDYLYVLLPKTAYPSLALLLYILRVGLTGATCLYALDRLFGKIGPLQAALAAGYALCTYSLAYNQANEWQFFVLIAPVFAVEAAYWAKGRGRFAFTVLLSFWCVCRFYYLAYMLFLFLGLFFLYRLFWEMNGDADRKGMPGRRVFFGRTAVFGGSIVLGAAMSGVMLVPTLVGAASNKGGLFANLPFGFDFDLLALPSKWTIGSFAWDNIVDGMPLLYCGMLTFILLLGYFFHKDIPRKEKVASGVLLAVLVISAWLTPVNLLWHGGSPPNWFTYRWAFLLVFYFVYLAGRCAASGAVSGRKRFFGMAGLIVLWTAAAWLFNENLPSLKRLALTLAASALYLVLIFVIKGKSGTAKVALQVLLTLAVTVELALNAQFTLSVFEYYSAQEYKDFITVNEARISELESAEPGFFRMEKSYNRTLNDPLLLDYNGISHFSSYMDNSQATLMQLGYRNYGACSVYGGGSTAFADSLLGIRYLMVQEPEELPAHFELMDFETAPYVGVNRYALPLSFSCPEEIADIVCEDTFELQQALLNAMTGTDETVFEEVALQEKAASAGGSVSAVAPVSGWYYFCAEVKNTDGVSLQLNGSDWMPQYPELLRNGLLQMGYFEAGEAIWVDYQSNNEQNGVSNLRVVGMDEEAFAACIQKIRAFSPSQLHVQRNQIQIICTSSGENDLLFTSLPATPDARIEVNGKEVEAKTVLQSLLSVPLGEGNNTVIIRYIPRGIEAGCVLSGFGAMIFLGILILQRAKKSKNRV